MIGMRLQGAESVVARLGGMRLSPGKARRMLRKMGTLSSRSSRGRIRQQRDLDGRPFAPRRRKDVRRKMLRGLGRLIRVRVEGERAIVYIPGVAGRIAAEHQRGFTEIVTAAIAKEEERRKGRKERKRLAGKGIGQSAGGGATRRQARRLRELGFKKSQKWLMETFTKEQAGAIIRKEEGRAPAGSWKIVVPARSFLGASRKDRAELGRLLLAELRKAA